MKAVRGNLSRRYNKWHRMFGAAMVMLSVVLVAWLASQRFVPDTPDTAIAMQTEHQQIQKAPETLPAQTQPTETVPLDTVAPVITGTKDILIYQGDTVQYMRGVMATDDSGMDPQITVDRSGVDLNAPGQYPVIYTARDLAGNTASVTVTITVMERQDYYVPLAKVYAEADALLEQIVTEDMNDRQRVEAIYRWIKRNCTYTSHSYKDNWIQAGYRMMKERVGDCFSYFGLCKLMLERQNIPNIDVEKVPNYEGDSMHYWSLVSIDGGKSYYHVDASPRMVSVYFCLVTDKVIDDFSAGYRNCFNRDKSLYPATPLEDLP